MTDIFSKKKTDRVVTPPKDPSLMHQAQRENFTIFMLRGMLAMCKSLRLNGDILSTSICVTIENACTRGINQIKANQHYRMTDREKAKKRKVA